MGHHYIPQKYLSFFATEDDPKQIWFFDKKHDTWARAAIKAVAQERGFYSPEDEARLAREVEEPGNRALDVLRTPIVVGRKSRTDAARYVATMLYRVPTHRKQMKACVPGAVEHAFKTVADSIDAWEKDGAPPDVIAKGRRQLASIIPAVRANPFQGSVMDAINSPWSSRRMMQLFQGMTWRIGLADGAARFLTGDNPVQHFAGLINQESEFVFPLSSTVALFGNNRGQSGATIHVRVPESVVLECNRRVAYWADRFVFFSRNEEWVRALAMDPEPQFNYINWL